MKKLDVFKAIEIIKKELSKILTVDAVKLNFSIDVNGEHDIYATVFYKKENGESSNFSVTMYGKFERSMSLDELILRLKSEAIKESKIYKTMFLL